MSEFRDNSGELVVNQQIRHLKPKGQQKVSTGCLHVCKNNVYNSEQWVVNIVQKLSNVIAVKQSD